MSATKNVALIIGSTRNLRVGPEVVAIVKAHLTEPAAAANVTLSVVDINAFNLPVFNEDQAPALIQAGKHKHPHSAAWSAEIAKHDGYIWVVPEYNGSIPSGAKNAIDYLYNEWIGKGTVIVSYGIAGGKKVSEHLETALTTMKLKVAPTRPSLSFHGGAGADLMEAMAKGSLADRSRKDWESDQAKEEIQKAFNELVDILKA